MFSGFMFNAFVVGTVCAIAAGVIGAFVVPGGPHLYPIVFHRALLRALPGLP